MLTMYVLTGEMDYEPSVVLGVYGTYSHAAFKAAKFREDPNSPWNFDGFRIYEAAVDAPASSQISFVPILRK